MTQQVGRHAWLNTVVGILDSAFWLDESEQLAVSDIVRKLLIGLRIPERGEPAELPMPLVQEMHASYYTIALDSPRGSALTRAVRATTGDDCVASLEAWRTALEDLILTAYPDLAFEERLMLTKVLTDLLAAIGVPRRAAAFFPDAVLRAHREIEA